MNKLWYYSASKKRKMPGEGDKRSLGVLGMHLGLPLSANTAHGYLSLLQFDLGSNTGTSLFDVSQVLQIKLAACSARLSLKVSWHLCKHDLVHAGEDTLWSVKGQKPKTNSKGSQLSLHEWTNLHGDEGSCSDLSFPVWYRLSVIVSS